MSSPGDPVGMDPPVATLEVEVEVHVRADQDAGRSGQPTRRSGRHDPTTTRVPTMFGWIWQTNRYRPGVFGAVMVRACPAPGWTCRTGRPWPTWCGSSNPVEDDHLGARRHPHGHRREGEVVDPDLTCRPSRSDGAPHDGTGDQHGHPAITGTTSARTQVGTSSPTLVYVSSVCTATPPSSGVVRRRQPIGITRSRLERPHRRPRLDRARWNHHDVRRVARGVDPPAAGATLEHDRLVVEPGGAQLGSNRLERRVVDHDARSCGPPRSSSPRAMVGAHASGGTGSCACFDGRRLPARPGGGGGRDPSARGSTASRRTRARACCGSRTGTRRRGESTRRTSARTFCRPS